MFLIASGLFLDWLIPEFLEKHHSIYRYMKPEKITQ